MHTRRPRRSHVAPVLVIGLGLALGCGGTTGREGMDEPQADAPVGPAAAPVDGGDAGAEPRDAGRPRRPDAGARGPRDAAAGSDAAPGGPVCGNGAKEGAEECDDGNALDGDGCSSVCSDAKRCEACLKTSCAPPDYAFPPCSAGVDGNATDGPAAGDPKAALCRAVYTCALRTGCGKASLSDCYCGTAKGGACLTPRAANGACKKELEGALETTDPAAIVIRYADVAYGGGVAMLLLQCAQESCASACPFVAPP